MGFSPLVKYSVIRNLRDKRSVVINMITMFLMTLILGVAMKDTFISENKDIEKFKVGLLVEDRGECSKQFKNYIEREEFKDVIEVKEFGSMDEAKVDLGSGKIKNIIFIPNNYSENVEKGNKAEIKIITERERNSYDNTVNSIISCFNKYENIAINKTENSVNRASKALNVKYINSQGKTPKSMDYYGVTMLVMLILSSSSKGCGAYLRLKNTPVGERQKITPIRKGVDTLANVVAEFIVGTLQWGMYVVLCKVILGVNYGSNIFIFIGLCSFLSLFSIMFGVLIGEIVGSYYRAQIILQFFIYFSTILSGGFGGGMSLLNSTKVLYNLLPSYQGHKILFSYIYFNNDGRILSSIGLMIMEICALILICFLVERRKRYDYIKK